MSVYEREGFGDFLQQVIRIREDAQRTHPAHHALVEGGHHDEEAVATLAADPDAAVRTRKALRTIHQDFPYGASVPEQSAYLLRGFIGLDPFGDRDRDTGWTYLLGLLDAHGWDLDADEAERAAFVSHLHDRLAASHPGGFVRRHVLDRDAVFSETVDWLQRRLRARSEDSDQHL